MKKMIILVIMMVLTISAKAMSYEDVKDDAFFLTDKMAYELSLTDEQYEAVYEINLDYLLCLNKEADLFGLYWERRNADLRYVLSDWQYEKFLAIEYYYRPVKWEANAWVFLVYSHYARDLFYFTHPKAYATYFGGNSFKNDRFYADRIHNKPASVDHHHAPAAHGTAPASNNTPAAAGNAAKPATPNNNARPGTPSNNTRPGAPNNNAKPATPNANNKPATPSNNRPSTPNSTPRPSAPSNGGGRPAGGGPGGGGPGGRR
jgi:hypothetical protein